MADIPSRIQRVYAGIPRPGRGLPIPFSPLSRTIFLIIVLFIVLPIFDVPLLGLSLTAPLFAFLIYDVIKNGRAIRLRPYRLYLGLAVWIWLGVAASALGNGLSSGGVNFDSQSILAIVRFAYWLLFFAFTVIYVAASGLGRKLAAMLGWGIFILALLRLGEVVIYGNIGAWTGTRLMTQNTYGFLFSSFALFCVYFVFQWKSPRRWLAWGMSVLLIATILLNGSRGSWIGAGVGLVVMLAILVIARPRIFGRMVFSVAVVLGLVLVVLSVWAPLSQAFLSRFSSMDKLEEDKSYAIRLLMNQKALRLFEENPLIGVGPYRFRKSSTPLDMPDILSYEDQSYFDRTSAHNSYLGFLAETGLAGGLPYAILLLLLVIKGLRAAIYLARRGEIWAAAVFASFVAMSVHMWVISSLTNTGNWFVYGMVGALIVTARQLKRYRAAPGRQAS